MDADLQDQFRQLGVSVAVDHEGTIAIMECNWPSLEAFLACSTQWRTAVVVMGGGAAVSSQLTFVGLDYSACDVVLRARNAPADVLDDIMAMEEAVLPVLNEVD